MIWLRGRTDRIQPALDSIRHTFSQYQRRADTQETIQLQKTNWKMVGNLTSLIIFSILLLATLIGVPTVLTKVKKDKTCSEITHWTTISTSSVHPATMIPFISQNMNPLCTATASWNSTGITVTGLPNGSSSTALNGLKYPHDIYVYDDGAILIADSGNNRIIRWNHNATEGINIGGTGAYGSWVNLLADPIALAVQGNALYVSDVENYRIQMFPLNSNLSSPDATTIIGHYGQGSSLMQINQVTNLLVPVSNPYLLYMADSKNHRILSWNSQFNYTSVVAGQTGISGSNSTLLNNPLGIALDERTFSLYIADTFNNRIQKYDMNTISAGTTVAGGAGQLNNPSAVQLDPSGTNMFIADTLNHRILLWLNGAIKGHTIAGNGNAGSSATQLNNPSQIRLDSNYNLYVVDTNNSRIQRFDLISNGC
ncbi:unnamed protein product [Adineta steineri]|uniref:NHL repeat containing protein n=1 Tax=Adineta steineri TaxID=433720 RepID=A0A814LHF4_9BILA|nr:unnamed protein product [Adineta steineri]